MHSVMNLKQSSMLSKIVYKCVNNLCIVHMNSVVQWCVSILFRDVGYSIVKQTLDGITFITNTGKNCD